jgi:hypothetical protein
MRIRRAKVSASIGVDRIGTLDGVNPAFLERPEKNPEQNDWAAAGNNAHQIEPLSHMFWLLPNVRRVPGGVCEVRHANWVAVWVRFEGMLLGVGEKHDVARRKIETEQAFYIRAR